MVKEKTKKLKTLLELRLEKDLSREKVSKQTNIEIMTLYQFETFHSEPNVIDALMLAKFYNKKINEIQWKQ